MNTRRVLLLPWLLALLALPPAAAAEPPPAEEEAAGAPLVGVTDAWARAAPKSVPGAIYLEIHNGGTAPDRLLAVRSEACDRAEIHRTVRTPEGGLGMRPVEDGVPVPAGERVRFEPGGLHVMCLGKRSDFRAGQRFEIRLRFEHLGEQEAEVEVRE